MGKSLNFTWLPYISDKIPGIEFLTLDWIICCTQISTIYMGISISALHPLFIPVRNNRLWIILLPVKPKEDDTHQQRKDQCCHPLSGTVI